MPDRLAAFSDVDYDTATAGPCNIDIAFTGNDDGAAGPDGDLKGPPVTGRVLSPAVVNAIHPVSSLREIS